ncbi:hypothetical protein KJ596_04235 [Patescibacteria group bacterium]|nr:hypothetical protein [Patescibacteria group bacterium]MBU1868293.1 hypothetical protein [Patescibacteria group bacterium]
MPSMPTQEGAVLGAARMLPATAAGSLIITNKTNLSVAVAFILLNVLALLLTISGISRYLFNLGRLRK